MSTLNTLLFVIIINSPSCTALVKLVDKLKRLGQESDDQPLRVRPRTKLLEELRLPATLWHRILQKDLILHAFQAQLKQERETTQNRLSYER